ncbi:DNA-binding protein [Streptococcus suis]|nr:DNA-binding protein [Streptococcus suis]
MTELELRLLRLLKVGKENAVPSLELATLLKVDERRLRHLVRNLRLKHGIAIIGECKAGARGLYIPANDTERLEGIRMLEKQVNEERKIVTALLNADLNQYRRALDGGIE